jgi:peptidyl-prolyl cis-trans isomerase SurA
MNLAQITGAHPGERLARADRRAQARAPTKWRQLRTGADFAKTAATYSDAPDALKGGEIGYRDRGPPAAAVHGRAAPAEAGPGHDGHEKLDRLPHRQAGRQAQPPPAKQEAPCSRPMRAPHPAQGLADRDRPRKRKLLEMKQRIDSKSAKFEDMAKQYSADGSASKGGELGWIYPGDTVPEFETAMNALEPGKVSDPVESPYGMHLIEVMERKTADVSLDRKRNWPRAR